MNVTAQHHETVALLSELAAAAGRHQLAAWLEQRAAAVGSMLDELLAPPDWNVREEGLHLYQTRGVEQRRKGNIDALQLLAELGREPRPLTDSERGVLRKYSGWGGVISRESDALAIPADVRPDNWRGLIDEFYTPKRTTLEVWQLLSRLVRHGWLVDDPRCLEPSAGIGRFLYTAPNRLDWTTVELDDVGHRLIKALYPDAEHVQGSFQAYMRDVPPPPGGDFDLVVGNPPYAKQGRSFNLERQKRPFETAHAYFLDAGTRRLTPGGVLGLIVPLGVVRGTGRENTRLRATLLRRCHWLGAHGLPGDLFDGAALGLVFVLLRRRAEELGSVLHDDQDILEGRYFETPVGKNNIGGRWASEQDGKTYREMVVHAQGARALPDMVLREPRAKAPSKKPSRPAPKKPKGSAGKKQPALTAPHHERALALGERVRRFRITRQDNPVDAELARPELGADLIEWTGRHGVPHDDEALKASTDPAAEAFVSAFDGSGALSPLLREPVPEGDLSFPGDPTELVDVVRWLSGRFGQAPWEDIKRWYKGSSRTLARDSHDDIMILQWRPAAPLLQHRREYLSGDLYARVDQVDAELRAEPPAFVAERLKRQRALLIETINPQPIDVIDIDFRSGLVPEECLSDWLSAVGGAPISARWADGVLLLSGERLPDDVQDIAAFASRQELYAREGKSRKTRRHAGDLTLQDRLNKDNQLLERFNRWLRQHERWGPHVADLYNRAYRAHVPRAVESDPLPLSRANPAVTLRGHQNNAIRTLTEMRGGIVGHDVGLGKTFTACGLVAWWRQLQLARRPIVVVPKQVVTNWLREFARLLPDYEVGAIGVQWSARAKKYLEDTPEQKRAKWQNFASGQYDVLIVTQPAFEGLPTRPDTRLEVLRDVVWLRREERLVDREQTYLKRRIAHYEHELALAWGSEADKLRKSLETAKAELTKHQDRVQYLQDKVSKAQQQLDDNTEPGQQKKLEKRLKTATKRLEEELASPTLRTLEAAEQAYEQWSTKTEFERKRELGLTFEELGCDLLIMDEAHAYKNLFRPQTRYGKAIKYLGSSGGDRECKRCWDLLVKTSHLRQQHDGAGVVLLTATPLKNSPVELYNLLTYVRPQLLEVRGIRTHEEFVDRYCGFATTLTLDTTQDIKDALVVDRFTHLHELRAIMDLVVDIRTADDVGLDIPGTKTEMVTVAMDGLQEAVYDQLRAEGRAARMSAGQSGSGNMLAVLRRMDYAALDLRLLDAEEYGGWDEGYVPPKYAELSKRIGEAPECAHIVFVSESRRESLSRCKQALVDHGLDPKRIITMHGGVKQGDRQHIVDGLNGVYEVDETGHETMVKAPQYDVIIGNSVMSEGLNLQRRACAIHHVDVPWTPSDLQQRNGRGVRQGNKWATGGKLVGIYYYLTEQSSDGYRLQLVSGKRGWMVTLLKSADNTVNNPLAESGLSDDDLILLFADDPESAKAELERRRKEAEVQQLRDAQSTARKRFDRLQVFRERQRKTADEELAANLDRQAAQIETILEATDDDIFPAKLRALIPETREHALYLWPDGRVLRPNRPVRLDGQLLWVYSIDPTARRAQYRLLGSPFVRSVTFQELGNMAPAPSADVGWDAKADAEGIQRPRHVRPHWLPDVAPDLIDAHWAALVASASRSFGEQLAPLHKAGELQVLSWDKARELIADGWTVLTPDDAGWSIFVDTPGGAKTNRRRVARQWWGRTAPEPEAEADSLEEAA